MEMSVSDPSQTEYYLLWRFDYGRCDCYQVIRSWLAGKAGIQLGDYDRLDLEEKPQQFMTDRFTEQGFEKVADRDDIQTHDLICFDIMGGTYNHIGVISDATANQFLHNLGEGHYSIVTDYDKSWRDRTRQIFRHKSLVTHDGDN
jgi:cell wall-associated NlpC family hydrolase